MLIPLCLLQVWVVKLPPASWAYSQTRMQHFLKLVGRGVIHFVQVQQAVSVACRGFSACLLSASAATAATLVRASFKTAAF